MIVKHIVRIVIGLGNVKNGLLERNYACCAVVLGTRNQKSCAPPFAMGTMQLAGTTTMGSELPGHLIFKSLNLYLRDFIWCSFESFSNCLASGEIECAGQIIAVSITGKCVAKYLSAMYLQEQ